MKCLISFLAFVVALVSAASIHNDGHYYHHTYSPVENRQPRNYHMIYPLNTHYPQPRDNFGGIDRQPQIWSPQPYYNSRHRRSPPELAKPLIHVEDYDEQPTPAPERFKRNSHEHNITQAQLLDIHIKPRLTDEQPRLAFGAGRSSRSAHKKEDKAVQVVQQRPAIQPMHASKNEFRYPKVKRNPPQGVRTLEFIDEDSGKEDDQYENDPWMKTKSKRNTSPATNDQP
nr:hypothetical protein HmN_000363500 [Hymenolepis microstoma]